MTRQARAVRRRIRMEIVEAFRRAQIAVINEEQLRDHAGRMGMNYEEAHELIMRTLERWAEEVDG